MDRILITIIVPVYRVEPYIRRCLDSIMRQTYKLLEIIVVDDGSPDNCGRICEEYAQKDERIIVIHKENGGLSSARNAALDIATGEYVMFVDSDDWVEPNFCETALKNALDKHTQIVAFGYKNMFVDKRGHLIRTQDRYTSSPRIVNASEAVRLLITRKDIIFNYAWNKIFKRSLFENVRFPIGRLYEDNAVTYLLVIKAHSLFVSDEMLYNYVRRNDSITGEGDTPRAIRDKYEIWSDRLQNIRKYCPENEVLQMKQLAVEALEGLICISRDSEYGYALSDFKRFLSENKSVILQEPCPRRLKLYYSNLFPLYFMARRLRLLR